jgi:hypothetical protein
MTRWPLLMIAALAFPIGASSTSVAQLASWRTYANADWGYRLQYPAHLFIAPEDSPENGGAILSTPDGQAQLFMFGGPNATGGGPRELADDLSTLEEIHRVTYRRVADDWVVLSGYLADGLDGAPGSIFYQRIEFSRDHENLSGFRIEYPPALRDTFDTLIGRIGRSLTPPR